MNSEFQTVSTKKELAEVLKKTLKACKINPITSNFWNIKNWYATLGVRDRNKKKTTIKKTRSGNKHKKSFFQKL